MLVPLGMYEKALFGKSKSQTTPWLNIELPDQHFNRENSGQSIDIDWSVIHVGLFVIIEWIILKIVSRFN